LQRPDGQAAARVVFAGRVESAVVEGQEIQLRGRGAGRGKRTT